MIGLFRTSVLVFLGLPLLSWGFSPTDFSFRSSLESTQRRDNRVCGGLSFLKRRNQEASEGGLGLDLTALKAAKLDQYGEEISEFQSTSTRYFGDGKNLHEAFADAVSQLDQVKPTVCVVYNFGLDHATILKAANRNVATEKCPLYILDGYSYTDMETNTTINFNRVLGSEAPDYNDWKENPFDTKKVSKEIYEDAKQPILPPWRKSQADHAKWTESVMKMGPEERMKAIGEEENKWYELFGFSKQKEGDNEKISVDEKKIEALWEGALRRLPYAYRETATPEEKAEWISQIKDFIGTEGFQEVLKEAGGEIEGMDLSDEGIAAFIEESRKDLLNCTQAEFTAAVLAELGVEGYDPNKEHPIWDAWIRESLAENCTFLPAKPDEKQKQKLPCGPFSLSEAASMERIERPDLVGTPFSATWKPSIGAVVGVLSSSITVDKEKWDFVEAKKMGKRVPAMSVMGPVKPLQLMAWNWDPSRGKIANKDEIETEDWKTIEEHFISHLKGRWIPFMFDNSWQAGWTSSIVKYPPGIRGKPRTVSQAEETSFFTVMAEHSSFYAVPKGRPGSNPALIALTGENVEEDLLDHMSKEGKEEILKQALKSFEENEKELGKDIKVPSIDEIEGLTDKQKEIFKAVGLEEAVQDKLREFNAKVFESDEDRKKYAAEARKIMDKMFEEKKKKFLRKRRAKEEKARKVDESLKRKGIEVTDADLIHFIEKIQEGMPQQ
uniref:Uncharacterized protein n=1 Tax=Chromera velia CCMP2878 TaxID=1169474 RepID=A0A0G4GLG7_9ALVE|mmetsp:Transcript_12821/g.25047  ORF Transcript_12821/g.25047 Transcript_12821/m.25047 type:complete len:724 (-) Transcript_12821:653-2824(-)|eukprot:Cvel_692.t1-p1 / transcript=Cvel_692.t1 / gene=Cvel_692 / organism=Chromera_velia_CCMP2878 / gene_product=hypothetical protein / transcript_product=hypothetical protein / location=Cvel_scaffold21:128190-131702(+) / protein_length=723 / sequence_SO=supercontig / SO=protein_coding / is_pseudo=false